MAENIRPRSNHHHIIQQSQQQPFSDSRANADKDKVADKGVGSGSGKSPTKQARLKHVDFAALRKTKGPMRPRKSNVQASAEAEDDGGMNVDAGDGLEGNGSQTTRRSPTQVSRESLGMQMETQRMQLISPPPEEVLEMRRLSGSGRGLGLTSGQPTATATASPITVSASASSTVTATPARASNKPMAAKRKRAIASPMKFSTSNSSVDEPMNGVGVTARQGQVSNATPNPKPRKQRHIREENASPTRAGFRRGSSPTVAGRGGGNETDIHTTTPTRSKKVVIKSPHARNPDADFIPALVLEKDGGEYGEEGASLPVGAAKRLVLSARGSRRSVTPIPAYEPPPDVFTPPREVYMSPAPPKSVSKSSKRKTGGGHGSGGSKRATSKGLRVDTMASVQVKQEIPDDIDLRAPMPPPSPTDDPLLLSGPPEGFYANTPTKERRKKSVSAQTQTQDVPMQSPMKEESVPLEMAVEQPLEDLELPPSSPEIPLDSQDVAAITAFERTTQVDSFNADQSTDDSLMQLDDPRDAEVEPVPLFDFADGGDVGDGGWSDSDDELVRKDGDEEGEGDYTGKWTMTRIKTKEDPPDSVTKMRQELWGRPVSPFPFPKLKPLNLLGEQEGEEVDDVEEEEVRRMSVEPEGDDVPATTEEEEEEEREVREMSMDLEVETDLADVVADEETQRVPRAEETRYEPGEEDDSDSDDEPDVVKITSADPMAAARAVAILKQHDYDCYTKLTKKRRASYSTPDDLAKQSRTRDVLGSGISKKRRRTTMGVFGDMVVIPGSPVMTLPELLQHAEKEVIRQPSPSISSTSTRDRDPFKTPLPSRNQSVESTSSITPTQYPPGQREWLKYDWKVLDACFTDLRMELAESDEGGNLALVDAVNLDDVVSRFVEVIGGQELVDTFGDSWTCENLLERARALQSKQRSGRGAPPTTPYTIQRSRQSSVDRTTPVGEPFPMVVPDFTPLARTSRLSLKPSFARPLLPPPIRGGLFSDLHPEMAEQRNRLPSTLLAPRYSHLLDEALDVSRTSHISPAVAQPESEKTEASDSNRSADESDSLEVRHPPSSGWEHDQSHLSATSTPRTIGTRVKTFITSYLPLLPKSKSPRKDPKAQPGLPLPPKEILEKSRGPVTTPARPPPARVPHPKELVQLNHAPLPLSHIPRPRVAPKRMVELNHVLPPPDTREKDDLVTACRPRRSSASSVKDLVQGFEKMEEKVKDTQVRHAGSVGSLRAAWKQSQPDTRPMWKP